MWNPPEWSLRDGDSVFMREGWERVGGVIFCECGGNVHKTGALTRAHSRRSHVCLVKWLVKTHIIYTTFAEIDGTICHFPYLPSYAFLIPPLTWHSPAEGHFCGVEASLRFINFSLNYVAVDRLVLVLYYDQNQLISWILAFNFIYIQKILWNLC